MNHPAAIAIDTLTGDLAAALAPDDLLAFSGEALLQTVGSIERLGRRVDALRIAAAAEVAEHSRRELGTGGLAAKRGCRSATELLERVTRASSENISKRIKVGLQTRTRLSIAGERMPPLFPHVAEALGAGNIGFDSSYAVIRGLSSVADKAGKAATSGAEFELVSAATGIGADSPFPCTADETKLQTDIWQQRLDQDGREPEDERALRMRGLRLGRERDGLIPVRGGLMPEIASKLNTLFDACMSPRTAPTFLTSEELAALELEHDPRTRDQQRHDVLAGIVDIASRSGEVPTMGGGAPTVLVSVRQSDLEADRGVGFIDGLDVPISMRAVKQFTCTGGMQKVVFDDDGRIIELGSPQRTFTPNQRKAITLRDGGCIIPGCNIPACWTEIHHVEPAANGGKTHTDNGVLLCWFHHRTIETSGWFIRMIFGVPHVKAPTWLDGSGTWRPAGKSRTIRLDLAQPIPI